MEYRVQPVEWEVVYPVRPDDPIGRIRRCGQGFEAMLQSEHLGMHPDGDAAAVAVWERFLELTRAEHEAASRVHGSRQRSVRRG